MTNRKFYDEPKLVKKVNMSPYDDHEIHADSEEGPLIPLLYRYYMGDHEIHSEWIEVTLEEFKEMLNV